MDELIARLEYLTIKKTYTNPFNVKVVVHPELGTVEWQEACAEFIEAHGEDLAAAIRADERAKVDGEIERLKSENIRLRETLGEILHAVCRAARAALEEHKP